ncbi:hypothetical protein Tco_1059721 [Tanacetum coccineum]
MDKIRLSRAQILWDDSDTSPTKKLVQATKGTRLKSKAKVVKPNKKKQHAKKTKAKGLSVLSESKVHDEKQQKTSSTDEETSTIPGVPDVPTYESKSEKESWGDSEEEDDNDHDGDNDDDGDSDDHDDDSDDERTESDREEIPDPKKTNEEHNEEEEEYDDEFNIEEEEKVNDEEKMDEEEDDEVTKELYDDVNVNLGNEDTDMTIADQDFTSKLLNLDNPSRANKEIAFLINTTSQHATVILEITLSFTIIVPPPPPFLHPLQQEATPTPTPTTLETTTSLLALLDFASIFKFNERVFNLEKDMLQIKQVNQYAQALSSIPAIILPQAVSDFSTLVIKKHVTESVEAAVLTRSSSQPTSTYEAATSLSEFELTKILIDKMKKNKSYDKADYKKKLYDALRSRDEDKDQDPFVGLDREKKRRKSSKDIKSSKDSRSEEKKSSRTSKDASQTQQSLRTRSSIRGPIITIEDSSMQQDQEFIIGDNDEQPADKEVTKADCCACEEPPTSFDEFNDTLFDFSTFVINRLKIPNPTQEILVRPKFNIFKGTYKSITELEYHLEECSKATTERIDCHNPENKLYMFDIRKPLPLIQDQRGRQIIPKDYFINKDLEYLKGGDLSIMYSTSVTKTKAATYELKWIEDLVSELRSPVQLKYDQHAYFGTSNWGPKRQSFYGYASNLTSSNNVYSRRRIIAVTRLIIMNRYDYGHLKEIEVRRDDQKLYTFKEGDFKRLRLQTFEDS